MPAKKWTQERLEWMRDVGLPKSASITEALERASKHFGESFTERPLSRHFRRAFGMGPGECLNLDVSDSDDPAALRRQIKRLQSELRHANDEAVTAREVRRMLGTLTAHEATPPNWLTKAPKGKTLRHGVPTLMLSDIHYGEVVNGAEVHHVNSYNSQIAADRIRFTFRKATHLLRDVIASGTYPGIVLALGGDMISGIIHDEIRESNDCRSLPALLQLADLLIAGIDLLESQFGAVFVPCVVGNHGRIDRKPRAKGGPEDNFEWLLYHMIARHYRGNKRVTIKVSDAFQTHWRVYGTTYLMEHGDSFRGGSGITGPLLPWALGDHRKRKQASSMGQWHDVPQHDVLLFGHWHTLFFGGSYIANGSVKGFDEYANKMNFSFEPPKSAAWITHPARGITFQLPVYASEAKRGEHRASWVEVAA